MTREQLVNKCQDAIAAIECLPGVTTEIVGVWCWAWGDTKTYKELLTTLGWKYAPKKQKWCWHPSEVTYHERRHANYRDIQATYGVVLHKENTDDI